jgi:predicted ester cyclase
MSEVRDLAELHVRSFNERAWSRAPQIYAPDIAVVEPNGALHGIDAFVGMSQGFASAFPDSRMEATIVIASGDHAVIEGSYSGTHTGPLATPQGEVPPTGRMLALPLCIVLEVAAGRITALRAYYDQMTFAAQLGLIPDAEPTS